MASPRASLYDGILADAPTSVPVAPAVPLAPPATPGSNIYDDIPADNPSVFAAKAKAAGTAVPPDQAAKVFNESVKSGVPPNVINADSDAFRQQQDNKEVQAAINASPDIASYISRVPLAAAISHGDWHNLIDASGHIKLFGNSVVGSALDNLFGPDLDTIAGAVKGSWKSFEQAWVDATKPVQDRSTIEMIFPPAPLHLAAGLYGLASSPFAPLAKAWLDFTSSIGIKEEDAAKAMWMFPFLLKGAGSRAVARLGEEGAELPKPDAVKADKPTGRDLREGLARYYEEFSLEEIGRWSDKELKDYLNDKMGFGSATARYAENTGKIPEPGMDEAFDQAHVAESKMHAESMDKLYKVGQESGTLERSPAAWEAYLNIASPENAGKNVWIPASMIADMYQGRAPRPDDDLFGYIPNINERLASATEMGAEISVPLAKYLAHTKEGPYGELKDFVRIEGGLTPEEAKTWVENMHPAEEKPPPSHEITIESRGDNGYFIKSAADPNDRLSVFVNPDAVTVSAVAIGKKARGKGLGIALYEKAIQFAQERGLPFRSDVSVKPDAVRVYEALKRRGYTVTEDPANPQWRFEVTGGPRERLAEAPKGPPQLATDTQYAEQLANVMLNAEKKSLYISSIFENEKAAGMSKDTWERFSQKLEAMDEEGFEKALTAARKEVAKTLEPKWINELNEIKDQVRSDLFSRGDIAANRFYRFGELPTGEVVKPRVKFNRDVVKGMVPEGTILRDMTAKDGVHPDDEANRFGYKTGRELIEALVNFDRARGGKQARSWLEHMIDEEAHSRMAAKHGSIEDILNEAAQRIALDKNHLDVLIDEYRHTAQQARRVPLTIEEITRSVKEMFGTWLARDATYKTFKNAAYSNALKARDAALKGKWDEALQWEERRLRSIVAAKMAREFEPLRRAGDRLFKRLADNSSLPNVDQFYVDWAHEILANLKRIPRWPVSKDLSALDQFMADHNGSLLIAPWIRNIDRRPGIDTFADLNVNELAGLINSIKSLMHNGKEARLVDSVMDKAELDNVNYDLKNQMGRLPDKRQPKRPGQTTAMMIKSKLRIGSAYYMPLTSDFDWIDQFNPRGPFSTYFTRPLHEASSREVELIESAVKMLMEAEKFRDPSLHDLIDQQVFWDELDRNWMAVDRQMLREIMGYAGSESGMAKLIGGYKIKDESDVHAMIARNATENDFSYVNLMFKLQDKLWELASKMEEEVTGVAPEKVEARPIEYRLSNGQKLTLDGGYWQIRYTGDVISDLTGGLFDQQYERAITTPHNWVVPRTQFTAPLDLTGAHRVSQIMNMVHDIAFRKPILSAARLMRTRNDPEHWRVDFARKFGAERNAMMYDWLRDLANSHNFDRAPTKQSAWAMRIARQNIEASLTFLNPSIVMKHVPTAAAFSALEVGVGGLAKGLRDIGPGGLIQQIKELTGGRDIRGMNPDPNFVQAMRVAASTTPRGAAARAFIYNSSAFMRERSRPRSETLYGVYDDINTPEAWKRWLRAVREGSARVGRFPVALGDGIAADATWLTEYMWQMSQVNDHGEAVYMADKAVLRSHGGPFMADKPAVMRIKGNDFAAEFMKSLVMFYPFWNRNFIGIVGILRDASALWQRGAGSEPGAFWSSILGRIFVRVVLVAVIDEVTRETLYPSKRSWGQIFLGVMAQTALGWNIYARNAVQYFYGYEPTFGAPGIVAKDVQAILRDIKHRVTKGEMSHNWIIHMMTMMGAASGVGGPQLGRTLQGAVGLETGQERPRSLGELGRLLQSGRIPTGE